VAEAAVPRSDGPDALERHRSIHVGDRRIDLVVRPAARRLLAHAAISRTAARALDAAEAPRPSSITVVLSDDAELAELNQAHMGHDGPTDVLSFPMLPPEAFPPRPGAPRRGRAPVIERDARTGRVHLGDIAISVERAIDQAEAGRGGQTGDVRWSAADELRLLVTHGCLHICGWDHAEPTEEAAMRALERELLRSMPAR
jgi:probable rRNA maturation factor